MSRSWPKGEADAECPDRCVSMTVLYDLLAAAAALLGGTLSAFLCEAFLERRETAVSPFCCLSCGRKRELWDRIPFLSCLLNGGKCRFCGAALSLREPILSLSHMALWPLALQLWLPAARFGRWGPIPADRFVNRRRFAVWSAVPACCARQACAGADQRKDRGFCLSCWGPMCWRRSRGSESVCVRACSARWAC